MSRWYGVSVPYTELLDFLEYRTGQPRLEWTLHYGWPRDDTLHDARVAELVGCCHRTVSRWRHADRVPIGTAERIADRLDEHPALIWPAWPEIVLAA